MTNDNKFENSAFEGTFWTVFDGDYYVSTLGNDLSGTGSPQLPFLTVHRAMQEALDNEKIIIGPSEYVTFTDGESARPTGSMAPCRLATIENINLSDVAQQIDGITPDQGDRILVWLQDNPTENGIYVRETSSWNRAIDFARDNDLVTGIIVPILEGDTYANDIFQYTSPAGTALGPDNLIFERVSSQYVDWGNIQGDITVQQDLSDALDTKATPEDITTAIDALKDNVPADGDTLHKLYTLIQNIVGVSASATDIADRDAQQSSLEDQQNIYVADATADATVTTGWAIYKYLQPTNSFVKIMEQENLDAAILTGGNGITVNGNSIDLGGTLSKHVTRITNNNSSGHDDKQFEIFIDNDDQKGSAEQSVKFLLDAQLFSPSIRLDVVSDIYRNNIQIGWTGINLSSYDVTNEISRLDIESEGVNIEVSNLGSLKINHNEGFKLVDNRGTGTATGLEYDTDYSQNFTERSLVDRAYVDSQIAAGGSGGIDDVLSANQNITQDRTINGDGHQLKLANNKLSRITELNVTGDEIELKSEVVFVGRPSIISVGESVFLATSAFIPGVSSSIKIDISEMLISDEINAKGLVYAADYSDNFEERSLVDKAYVDKKGTYDEFIEVSTNISLNEAPLLGEIYSGKTLLLTGDITITMPSLPSKGFNVALRNKDANLKTIDMNGNTLEYKGSGSPTMTDQYDMAAFTFDGTAFLGTGDLT